MTQSASNLPALISQLPTVKSQQELTTALDHLKQHFNVLVPAHMNFSSPLHKVALEAVQLDPTVDQSKNGVDIYSPDGGDRFTLHYKAANKIAGAAGISWMKSHVTKRDIGEDGRVIYVEHVVDWEVKRPNGSVKRGATTGFYRYEEDKARFKKPGQIESRRRFAEALAESNAKLRGIFEALEMLPRHFTVDEIRKPFLVPCVIEDINELAKDDPEIKRMIAAHSLGIIDQVYGPGKQSDQRDLRAVTSANVEVLDDPKPTVPTAGSGSENRNPETSDPGKLTKEEFSEQMSRKTVAKRRTVLDDLLKKKNAAWTFQTNFEDIAPNRQVEALWHFYSMPDPVGQAAEKFPWEK